MPRAIWFGAWRPDRRGRAARRRRAGLLPAGRRGGDADRLLPRQPDPRRGLAAVPRARRPRDRDRHAGLGALGPARPGALRLLDVRALGLPRALPRRARRRPAQAGRPRLGRAGADRGAAAAGAGRAAGRRSTRCRCCPATAGTGSPDLAPPPARASSLNATTTSSSMALLLRQARGDRGPMPPEFVDMIWDHWDKGTSDADPRPLPPRRPRPPRRAPAGTSTSSPARPWSSGATATPTSRPRFAEAYAEALPNAELEIVAGAGHWPWIDDARRRSTASSTSSPERSASPLTRGLQLRSDVSCLRRASDTAAQGLGRPRPPDRAPRRRRPRLRVRPRDRRRPARPRLRPRPADHRLRARDRTPSSSPACRRSSCRRNG